MHFWDVAHPPAPSSGGGKERPRGARRGVKWNRKSSRPVAGCFFVGLHGLNPCFCMGFALFILGEPYLFGLNPCFCMGYTLLIWG